MGWKKMLLEGDACRIHTGQYTGDGTENHGITGVGFSPKVVLIFVHVEIEGSNDYFLKIADFYGELCLTFWSGGNSMNFNKIKSLDADGFTVSDHAENVPPNALDEVYDYVCWG